MKEQKSQPSTSKVHLEVATIYCKTLTLLNYPLMFLHLSFCGE